MSVSYEERADQIAAAYGIDRRALYDTKQMRAKLVPPGTKPLSPATPHRLKSKALLMPTSAGGRDAYLGDDLVRYLLRKEFGNPPNSAEARTPAAKSRSFAAAMRKLADAGLVHTATHK